MKFGRNVRMSRTQMDMAPFASVFFLILIFIFLRALVYTPGVRIELPVSSSPGELPGITGPTVAVAIDGRGQLYFENQAKTESELSSWLLAKVKKSPEPVTLVLFQDKSVPAERSTHVMELASKAGITNGVIALRWRDSTRQRNPAP